MVVMLSEISRATDLLRRNPAEKSGGEPAVVPHGGAAVHAGLYALNPRGASPFRPFGRSAFGRSAFGRSAGGGVERFVPKAGGAGAGAGDALPSLADHCQHLELENRRLRETVHRLRSSAYGGLVPADALDIALLVSVAALVVFVGKVMLRG